MIKRCKYCLEEFEARRRNHVYCCNSCKTMASYERNGYKYVSGHYKKVVEDENLQLREEGQNQLKVKSPDVKEETVSAAGITNAGLGNLAADGISYGVKKIFAPQTLAATKGDINTLKEEITSLKNILRFRGLKF